MRFSWFFGALFLGLVVAAVAYAVMPVQEPTVERPPSPFHQIAAENGMIAINLGGDDLQQQVGLVDTEAQRMLVYHVDRVSGAITLKSVRNFTYDLLIDDFNGRDPLPNKVRNLTNK